MMKVEGECKDQTQRVGEERDIECTHARWWCVCVRMSDGAGEEMLASTKNSNTYKEQIVFFDHRPLLPALH